jgi:cell wall-associated NlpC family hydrolase
VSSCQGRHRSSGTPVTASPATQLQPVDLLFYAFDVSDPRSIHHVGLYVGGGQMIEAPHTGASIRDAPVLPHSDYIGAIRLLVVPAG